MCAPIALNQTSVAGKLNVNNAAYVLACLDAAIDACINNHAMRCNRPIQKSVINDAGIPFSGHTEYLAQKTILKLLL